MHGASNSFTSHPMHLGEFKPTHPLYTTSDISGIPIVHHLEEKETDQKGVSNFTPECPAMD